MDSNSNHVFSSIVKDALRLEAQAILDFAAAIPETFFNAINVLRAGNRIVCAGMGKSGHIASKVCATLVSTGTPSQFLHPAEALHGDLGLVLDSDVLLAFSNSGETEEIIRILPFFRDKQIPVVSIVGRALSTLGQASSVCISYHISREACPHNLAPTSSTTLSLAIGDAIAIALMKDREFTPIDFARFHPGGSLGRKLLGKVSDFLSPCAVIDINEDVLGVTKTLLKTKALIGAVVDRGSIVGAITLGDIVRTMSSEADDRIVSLGVPAALCMSRNPVTTPSTTLCSDADKMLVEKSVNSIIVLDLVGNPIGAYTLGSAL